MEEGTCDKVDAEVADRVSLSAESWKPFRPKTLLHPHDHRMRIDQRIHRYGLH
jgi:hypothetical protein